LPAGQDPDDLIRASGREALQALLDRPESLVDKLWRHELDAEPLTTPERKAGLRRRLLDHVGVIADPDVREQYRFELLARFNALTLPPRQWAGRSGPAGRFTPPPRPTSAEARSVGRTGLSPQLARAVLQGLVRFPALIGQHAEAIAALPIAEPAMARIRDLLLESAMTQAELDP